MREMKDSGIEWIGEIPLDWQAIKLKFVMDNFDYERIPVDSTKRSQDGEQLYDYYGASGVIDQIDGYTSEGERILIGEDGANLLLRNLPVIYIANGKYWVNNHAHILKPKGNGNLHFFANQMECIDYTEYITGSAQPKLSQSNLGQVWLVVPPVEEQNLISAYLDSKCAEIDALTADIQSQIDTLEQYKRSVITEAVTKGLDKDVEMKESGSQYWGDIPVKWDIVDIKYLFEIVKRIAGHEGYDILSITQHGIKVRDTSTNEGQVAADYSNYQFLYPGEYAMNHMDLLTGWVDLSDKFGVTSPDYRVFRLRDTKRNSRRYYKYIMQICYMCRIFYSLGNGVSNLGRWRLQTSSFNNFKVPVPPYEEQEEISDYLDAKIREIEATIELKNEQLSTLDLFKKSLIYEYVTGKKEVPAV